MPLAIDATVLIDTPNWSIDGNAVGAPVTLSQTIQTLIERVRREVYGSRRIIWNALGASMAPTDTSLTLGYPPQAINYGDYLCIDQEMLYIWATSGQSQTVPQIQRGMLGTTPVAHLSGALVEVNARFPAMFILEALRDEIASWPNELFQVRTGDVAVKARDTIVNLDGVLPAIGGYLSIIEVLVSPRVGTTRWRRARGRLERSVATGFPGGVYFLSEAPASGATARVTAAMPMNLTSFDPTTQTSAIGLADSMFDIAVLGAAWRLLAGREITRTDTLSQGEPRAATEVPVGATSAATRSIKQLRDIRIAEEAQRLRRKYPWRLY